MSQNIRQQRCMRDYQTARERLKPRPPVCWLVWMRIKNFRLEWD